MEVLVCMVIVGVIIIGKLNIKIMLIEDKLNRLMKEKEENEET